MVAITENAYFIRLKILRTVCTPHYADFKTMQTLQEKLKNCRVVWFCVW